MAAFSPAPRVPRPSRGISSTKVGAETTSHPGGDDAHDLTRAGAFAADISAMTAGGACTVPKSRCRMPA